MRQFFSQHVGQVFEYDIAIDKLSAYQSQINLFEAKELRVMVVSSVQSNAGKKMLDQFDEYKYYFEESVMIMRDILTELRAKAQGDLSSFSFSAYKDSLNRMKKADRQCNTLGKWIRDTLNDNMNY